MKIRRKNIFYISAAFIIIITGVLILIFYKSRVSYDGTIHIEADSQITIERDKAGIPFIHAGTLKDAYFAIGFLHAQDRLSLIEYYRAIAGGKLSAITGRDGLFPDKVSKTIGFARQAEIVTEKLKAPYIDYLNSYIRGINESKKINYNISRFRRIPTAEWTAKDAVSILLLFEWADSFLNNKELVFPLPGKLNPANLKNIIPEGLIYQYPDEERSSVNLFLKIKNTVREWIGPFQEGFAFYISRENMDDGKSVSGFSMDGDIGLYPKWYPFSLVVGEKRIDGITASGLPFVFYGRNDDFSFFGFNISADTQDFYIENSRTFNDTQYYYRNGGWNKFHQAKEKIYTDSNEDGLEIQPRSTDIGPVLSDLNEKEEDAAVLSIHFLFPDESYINSLFNIPFAQSIAEAKRSTVNIYSLPRLYLFASDNDAVYSYSGKINHRNISKIFRDGGSFAKNIIDISVYGEKPPANIIAGSDIFDSEPEIIRDYLVFKDINRYNTFKILTERENLLTSKDIIAALNNTRSTVAEKFTPIFLKALEQIPLPSAKLSRIYLNNWNYEMNSDSVAATIFNCLLINMMEETIGDELGNSKRIVMDNYYYLADKFYSTVSAGNSILFDDVNTKDAGEKRDNIFDRAFIKTLRYLNKKRGPIMEDWKWGTVHNGRLGISPNKNTFLQRRLNKLNNFEVYGDNSTVKKGGISTENLLYPSNIPLISGVFYLDLHLSFISLPVSTSLSSRSEYFREYDKAADFAPMDASETIHKLILFP